MQNGYIRYVFHMTLDLRQLRYFIAVAEELHFTRAAERLGIAQPPLTQQIQKLESHLGCKVFTRGRSTSLTPAGAVLLEEARRILAHVDTAVESARRAARGETGRLAVGVPPSVMLAGLPAVIRKYRDRYPAVAFTLREMSTSAIEHAVTSGEVDLGFLREATPGPPLISKILYEEPVVAVLPKSHRLAARASIKLSALQHEPFVFFPKRLGPTFHDRLTALCVAAGFTPNIVEEATQWQTVISLVEAGMGVSLAPACVRKFRWSHVVYRPLPGATTSVSACWPEADISPTAAAFLKMAKSGMSVTP
jgi:DNA-binding transcriptional LysR family regulator